MTTNNTEEHDRLYNILQHQGFHEDTIDEMTIEQMREFSSTDVINWNIVIESLGRNGND